MKTKSISQLKKKLDEVFSKYIRYRDQGQCFTCPKKDHPKKMQCGHFNPRQYLATRYDETNNNCQCYACNMLYGGNPATYSVRLIEKYGLEHVKKLESLRWTPVKLTPMWYEDKIAYYKAKLSELGVD